MVLHPRHRGDCADFFATSDQPERFAVDGPRSAISEIEYAAARAGRTWNEQFSYVLECCLGDHLPDFDDARSVEDWRTLLTPCRYRMSEAETWTPCTRLWWKPYRQESKA